MEEPMIEWKGGPSPVVDDAVVEYKLRKGTFYTRMANKLDWHHKPDDAGRDIVAYRIVDMGSLGSRNDG